MKKTIISILIFSLCLVFAGQKEFVRDYTYQASEIDSKVTARTNASTEIRNILLREIGQFIISTQSMSNNDDYSEKVQAITAGIVEMVIITEKWNGQEYYIQAKMTVDEKDVEKRINEIMKDYQRTNEFRDARKRALEAEMEVMSMRNNKAAPNSYKEKVTLLAVEDDFTSAMAAYENGRYAASLEYLNNSLKSGANKANIYYMLGKVYAGMNETKKSDEYFKKSANMGHPAAQYRIRNKGYHK